METSLSYQIKKDKAEELKEIFDKINFEYKQQKKKIRRFNQNLSSRIVLLHFKRRRKHRRKHKYYQSKNFNQ